MPPKKDAAGAEAKELLVGFTDKETKLLAAAFLSSIGPDKVDYDLMATITGHTAGTLKKFWPPVKRKAIEKHASFANFLGTSSRSAAPASEASQLAPMPKPKKRKIADDVDQESVDSEVEDSESDKVPKKNFKKPVADKDNARPKKQLKAEDADAEEHASDSGEDSQSEAEQSV